MLEQGKLTRVVAVFHDITELKRLLKMRSEFVAKVSHELKTPLTSIKGFVETITNLPLFLGAEQSPANTTPFK